MSPWPRTGLSGLAIALSTMLQPVASPAAPCAIVSAPNRVPLVELYTSEGCSSCPPADRWLSSLPAQGVTSRNAVTLAFHVDYWNDLGWLDRFSQAQFSQRQRVVAARAETGVIYTPQVLLDGKAFRPTNRAELQAKLASINRETSRADIQARLQVTGDDVHLIGQVVVPDARDRGDAEVWVAAFENGLATQVQRGENAGRELHHDFVVRYLAGPTPIGTDGRVHLNQHLRLGSDWDLHRTGIAVFVQRRTDGQVLQATTAAAACGA